MLSNNEVYALTTNIPRSVTNIPRSVTNSVKKYRWTADDNIIVTQMFISGESVTEVKERLPHLKLSSIKMKYGNCLFLQNGPVKGALANVSAKHRVVWTVLTAK